MQAPAVMFIESAADTLKRGINSFIRNSQMKELKSFGDERAKQLGASGVTNDFQKGYELGLQTARTIIFMSVAVRMKGVNPEDIL